MIRFRTVALVAVAVLVGAFFMSASASAIAPVWMSPADNANHVVSHRCAVFGPRDAYGNHAVHCADLVERSFDQDGSATSQYVRVWGQNRVLCQNSVDQTVQCAGIHETVTTCSTPSQGCTPISGVCGARFGHNPCSPAGVTNVAYWHQWRFCSDESWGASVNDQVVLPQSGLTVGGTGNNIASAHYEIANGWQQTRAFCAY